MYDGTLVHNLLPHTVLIQPYRADGLAVKTYSPEIGHDEWRLVNNDHIGDADYFFLVAFMKDAEVPERIGVTQATWQRSGSVGISLGGGGYSGGLTIGGGEGGTSYFSASMAAAVVKLTHNPKTQRFESNEKFLLISEYGQAKFDPGDTANSTEARDQMILWRLIYAPQQKSRPRDDQTKGW